jgi:predicted nucleic acid-binding protein
MELVQGMRDKKELNSFMKQLTAWKVEILQVDKDISTRAMIYIEQYFLSNSMEMADALIAAACVNDSEVLLTANEKHYRHVPNIQLKKFAP